LQWRRRIIFGFIAAVLIAAFFTGFNPDTDFENQFIIGNMFYGALTVVSAVVGLYNNKTLFDLSAGEVSFSKSFAGLTLRNNARSLSDLSRVVLQTIVLVKGSGDEGGGRRLGQNRMNQFLTRRRAIHKLILEFGDDRAVLDDSASGEDLSALAKQISSFCGKALHTEEI
jgi:hypothetical protein